MYRVEDRIWPSYDAFPNKPISRLERDQRGKRVRSNVRPFGARECDDSPGIDTVAGCYYRP